MKNGVLKSFLGLSICSSAFYGFSAEDCPVSKISLARGLACEVLQLAGESAEADSKIDSICLKLGRVSAIMRRTQGQLPNRPTAPIPPVLWKSKAMEIEGFCGLGSDEILPRGLLNPEIISQDEHGLKSYIKSQLHDFNEWISNNYDPENIGCPTPAAVPRSLEALCTKL